LTFLPLAAVRYVCQFRSCSSILLVLPDFSHWCQSARFCRLNLSECKCLRKRFRCLSLCLRGPIALQGSPSVCARSAARRYGPRLIASQKRGTVRGAGTEPRGCQRTSINVCDVMSMRALSYSRSCYSYIACIICNLDICALL
jgi:hypothetical protein